jgi:putative nucleotidyltransferase with HDIG domain
MSGSIFGRRLYGQIVWPLVLAAVVVGLVATVVAVSTLASLTNEWVDEVAEGTLANLHSRLDLRVEDMERVAALLAADVSLREELTRGDSAGVSDVLARVNSTLRLDSVEVIASDGTVVAATGKASSRDGESSGSPVESAEPSTGQPTLRRLPDDSLGISVSRPLVANGTVFAVRLVQVVDGPFLREIAGGVGDAALFFDANHGKVAQLLTSEGDEHAGASGLRETLAGETPASVIAAMSSAHPGTSGYSTLRTERGDYRVVAMAFDLDGTGEQPAGYLVSVVSRSVSDQARSTTTSLISMWSIVAVLALTGLGSWIARRVSDPLIALTEGAKQIAEGDFSTRMPVSGSSEIAGLAETFNEMTDSLRERSESLTKKVLELATLYEMSRALGSTLDMDELLDSVLDSALRIFGVDLGYVTLWNEESGVLELRAWRGGERERPDANAIRSSMSEWVVREGRPLIFNPAYGQSIDQVDRLTGAPAALCVPLISTEGTMGAITVGTSTSNVRFSSDDVRLLSTIANHMTIAIGNIGLFSSLQNAYLSTVRSLAAAVDAKDAYTRGHSEQVAAYALQIAERMELSHDQRTALEMAAYLHDIGKIGVQESILLKPGALDADEMAQMSHHPLIGANILKPVGFPWPITPIVRHHHEKWDGTGYPAGLQGEEIPLLARILTVADAFEAMIADRPYRAGRTLADAIAELHRCSGSHFDPRIVDVFVDILLEQGGCEEVAVAVEIACPEEAQAIFVALSEGMLDSFRRLAGPRLAANVETSLNRGFDSRELPFRVAGGKMMLAPTNGDGQSGEERMRAALRMIDEAMSQTSGQSLVDNFYDDAFARLSERMRLVAVHLEFYMR